MMRASGSSESRREESKHIRFSSLPDHGCSTCDAPVRFAGETVVGRNMSSARFENSEFVSVSFKDCTFSLCNFWGARFRGVVFLNCRFVDCVAFSGEWSETQFLDSHMRNVKFTNITLRDVTLERSKVRGSILQFLAHADVKFLSVGFLKTDLTLVVASSGELLSSETTFEGRKVVFRNWGQSSFYRNTFRRAELRVEAAAEREATTRLAACEILEGEALLQPLSPGESNPFVLDDVHVRSGGNQSAADKLPSAATFSSMLKLPGHLVTRHDLGHYEIDRSVRFEVYRVEGRSEPCWRSSVTVPPDQVRIGRVSFEGEAPTWPSSLYEFSYQGKVLGVFPESALGGKDGELAPALEPRSEGAVRPSFIAPLNSKPQPTKA